MLTVYSSTCCRPDLVQLQADALAVTLGEPYEFVVQVHAGGIAREWRNVDRVIRADVAGYHAWHAFKPDAEGRDSVWLHDDTIPVAPWTRAAFPLDHMTRPVGDTVQYHAGGWRSPAPLLEATRVSCPEACPAGWLAFCEAAAACHVEALVGGVFLHIDKGTLSHPDSPGAAGKRQLVEAIAAHLGVAAPEPLTADELAAHPGRMQPAGHDVAQMGLGDYVAAGLSAVGITKERVSAALGRPCGCEARQAALNDWGAKTLGIGTVDSPR